jgi:peptidyl-prolyl cis-trans isomerase B (cyclophilin B)
LVSSRFYDGLVFHRYVSGFVIQGGDPTGTGGGGSDKTIPLEVTKHKHVKGALGMARTQDPNSASSQFYICLDDTPNLDGGYAVFGQVVDGMENVLQLRQGDKMVKVTLLKSKTGK